MNAAPVPNGRPVARLLESALAQTLRTPLHSVLGFGELLMMTELDSDQHRLVEQVMAATEELLAGSHRLTVLLGTLSGAAAPTAQPFELSGVLADVQAIAGHTGITVQVDPAVPATMVGDVEALRYVLAELVTNAVQHGRRPVTIAVETAGAATGTHLPVRFTVTDSGPGIPAEQVTALTDEQPPVPDSAVHLGLYLVAQLARRLGGRVTVDDSGRRVAVQVSLRLPAMARRSSAPAEPAEQPLRVLLVEDNAVNRLLTTRQMARLGHTLHTVNTGAEGVDAALADRYDVILMDRHLPDLDGIEATRAIRAAETEQGLARTPIIAVTADAGAGHREQCLAAGMDAFLSKPVNLERLRAALTAVAPQPEPAPGTDMDIDLAALEALAHEFDGDRELTAEVVNTYLAELPGRRLRLQTAIRQGVARGAIVAADGLRAASLTVGAVGVARICAEIVSAASGGDLELSRKYLPELLDACGRAADSLMSLASSGRCPA